MGEEDTPSATILDSLKRIDFFAVLAPYFPESLADRADLLLPIPLWMEEDGTYTSLDGSQTAFKNKVLDAPEGVKDAWETLSDLAGTIGFRPDFKTWRELCEKAKKERLRMLYSEEGIYRCHTAKACSFVCPKEIDVAHFIGLAKEGRFREDIERSGSD